MNPTLIRVGRGLMFAGTAIALIAIFVGDFNKSWERLLYVIAFACLFVSIALSFIRRTPSKVTKPSRKRRGASCSASQGLGRSWVFLGRWCGGDRRCG